MTVSPPCKEEIRLPKMIECAIYQLNQDRFRHQHFIQLIHWMYNDVPMKPGLHALYECNFHAVVSESLRQNPVWEFNRGTGGFLDQLDKLHLISDTLKSMSVGDIIVWNDKDTLTAEIVSHSGLMPFFNIESFLASVY